MQKKTKKIKTDKYLIDHNNYEVNFYEPIKKSQKVIIFPTCNYQGDQQYIHLIDNLVIHGYRVITVKLLNRGDKILVFDYYFGIFQTFLQMLYSKDALVNEEITLMGFGLSGYLVSYMNSSKMDIERIICISPLNRFKSEYSISRSVSNYNRPTYFYFGQLDSLNSVDSRYAIFASGKNNPNVHFNCYAYNGLFCYYESTAALELEKLYKNNDINLIVGSDKKSANVFLPTSAKLNDLFFRHLFNDLNDYPNPQRIALFSDTFPLVANGVEMVLELLQNELSKKGYETYIVALWQKNYDYSNIPNHFYIPIDSSYANLVKGHKKLKILKNFAYSKNAKMLAMFGFKYLHLHSEYSISGTALELAKLTGIQMPYTYHTLWNIYYYHKFGKLMGDITYKAAKQLLFNRVWKECPTLIVPSKKSYKVLKGEVANKDVRIFPSPINMAKFTFDDEDEKIVEGLINKYKLKNKLVIGYVGRISLEKNILETIEYISRIIKEIPNLVFMIVGTGDAEEALKKHIKKLGLVDNIIFVGEIHNDETKYYYRLFKAFVTASNFETQGLTYFEAAACGTPIIARADEAIEGIFKDGINSFIYKDFYQWTERLEKALFKDTRRISEAARATLKSFSADRWSKQMLDIYKELNPEK